MLLAVDIGNTNINFGIFKGNEILCSFRLFSSANKTKDEYAADLDTIFKVKGVDKPKITEAIIGSVVPYLSGRIKKAIKLVLGVDAKEVLSDLNLGLTAKNKMPLPSELGADILEFAVAVKEIYKQPAIMIDMGTATTIFALNGDLELEGGLITAGPSISLDYMVQKAALLTSTDIEDTGGILGLDTPGCISAGYLFGGACMIDGICQKIESHLKTDCLKIATGGLSKRIIEHCSSDIIFDEDIVLKGIKIIYDKIKG